MNTQISTKAMRPATKAMPTDRIGNKARTASTKARKPINWQDVGALPGAIGRAADIVDAIAGAEPATIPHDSPARYAVDRREVTRLDDDDLLAYGRELRHARDKIVHRGGLKRTHAANGHRDLDVISRAVATISKNGATIVELYDELAASKDATAKEWRAAAENIDAMLAEVIAEQERRTPKSAADLAREVDDLRGELEKLRARPR